MIGLSRAEQRLGEPIRRRAPETIRVDGSDPHAFGRGRRAEVVMVLPRPGGVLMHSKAFYPHGVLRLLTGGVHDGEDVQRAAAREAREETGLSLKPVRFLFHFIHVLEEGSESRVFHTLGFLYPPSALPAVPTDPDENITELTDVSWSGIEGVIARLELLAGHWRAWGRFRAGPHRLLLEVRRDHPDWFQDQPQS